MKNNFMSDKYMKASPKPDSSKLYFESKAFNYFHTFSKFAYYLLIIPYKTVLRKNINESTEMEVTTNRIHKVRKILNILIS